MSMPRLKEKYQAEILPGLQKEFSYASMMQVPRITKITLNMGLGEAVANKNVLQSALSDLEKISGQKPVLTKAKRSEANFKIRTGWPIGAKVTLRRDRMYEFLDRLISVAIPRVRDFRGLPDRSFDGRETTHLESRSKSYSLKSTTTTLTPCGVWMSASLLRRAVIMKQSHCSGLSIFH